MSLENDKLINNFPQSSRQDSRNKLMDPTQQRIEHNSLRDDVLLILGIKDLNESKNMWSKSEETLNEQKKPTKCNLKRRPKDCANLSRNSSSQGALSPSASTSAYLISSFEKRFPQVWQHPNYYHSKNPYTSIFSIAIHKGLVTYPPFNKALINFKINVFFSIFQKL